MNRIQLQSIVEKEGLILLGVAPLFYLERFESFERWIRSGKHADLKYLEKYWEVRKEPHRLLPQAQSALILGLPYAQGDQWPLAPDAAPRVAQYARFKDYHKILHQLGRDIITQFKTIPELAPHSFRLVVDTAPLLERALAEKTASGFIGKNTCFIHPSRGSFLLLAEILSTYPFELDKPSEEAGCGTCSLCQVECPTGALNEDYTLDSHRCLAYWTIEHRGPIPLEFWPWLEKYYFGCDICQLVCPYNASAPAEQLPLRWKPRNALPSLFEVATMTATQYQHYFGGTPMTRAKREGLRRNALIALFVTQDPRLNEAMAFVEKDGGYPLEETVAQIKTHAAFCSTPNSPHRDT